MVHKKFLTCSLLILVGLGTLASVSGQQSAGNQASDSPKPIYLDMSYSFEERAADLVSRMTLEEKQSQLGNTMPAVPRLGVNAYNVWGEALHGVLGFFRGSNSGPTSFPNSVATGASWDPELIQREATAISTEARGINSEVIRNLTFWSPVVEPMRDPRWGRNGESYGEDPFLISRIAGGFIRGMMGSDPTYLKAVPTGKHFFANNSEFNRHVGSSNMDARDLREFYISQYRYLIEEQKLPSIMTCYNRVNGHPITGSKYFVDSVVRKIYGLNGYVTGDCGAVGDIRTGHKVKATSSQAAAMALKAGVDTDCGSEYQKKALDALRKGLLTEGDIDRALVHMFTIRMRFGEFDPKDAVPYSSITRDSVATPEHAALAVEVAKKTPVLLKNEMVQGSNRRALPLDIKRVKKIALLGPKADEVELGPYSGRISEEQGITPLEGIQAYFADKGAKIEVVHSAGASAAGTGNLFNVAWFELVKKDGSTQQIRAGDYFESSEGVRRSGEGQDRWIRNVADDAWTSYLNADVSNIDKINLRLAVPGEGGSIEFHVNSRDGESLGTFELESTGGQFTPETKSIPARSISASGDQTLYLVFHAAPAKPIPQETLDMASSADVAVVFVGTDERTATEEADRKTLDLPGNQLDLIQAVSKANPNTIVVMQTLGMVEVEAFKNLAEVPGIIWTGYNGQGQGAAIAPILFGEVNPGGKLNFTWYKSMSDLPAFTDYNLRGGPNNNGRTHWYFKGDVSYPFGYGLSYTSFAYSNVRIDKNSITPNDKVTVSVDVKNTGKVDGDEVVELYVSTPDSPASLQRPIRRLKGFQRVTIPAGKTESVSIPVDCSDLWFWDPEAGRITFDQGRYVFEVGASSRDIKGTAEATLSGTYTPYLRTVVAEAPQVQLRIGSIVPTTVTAAMSDDTFADLAKTRVTYSSSRPSVASVDSSGIVTAQSPGVATITASVTIDGNARSGSYAVKVLPDLALAGLTVNGRDLGALGEDNRGSSFLLDRGAPAPRVQVKAASNAVTFDTAQAGAVPGTAIVTLTDNVTGEKTRYGVNFGTAAESDEFTSTSLGSQWHWLGGNPSNWSLEKNRGSLLITAEEGDLKGEAKDAKNVLLQPANTDWFIESKVTFSRAPSEIDQQGGLLAYQDDDNFVKLVYDRANRGFQGTGNYFELVVEREGSQYPAATFEADGLMDWDKSIVFRLEKKGSRYTAYYSKDGNDFELLGTTDVVLADVQVGLFAVNGSPVSRDRGRFAFREPQPDENEPPFEMSCDYFDIRSRGQKLP
ncbi:MAG: glycoside hydrolase family 3 C-terminal domain-containing protein [Acidobacteriota bacterium]